MSPKLMPSIARFIFYLALASVIVTFYRALTPSFIADGLDPSWRAAMLFVRSLNLGYGDQVVFTTGPLSHVYDLTFSKALYHEKILSILLIALFYTLFIAKIAHENRNVFVACIAVLPFFVNIFVDPAFIGLPLCASLLGTLAVQSAHVRALVALGAAASAVATLAKFSVFPVAVAGFFIVDILAVTKRRFPIALVAYGLSMAVLLLIISPQTSLIDYLRSSLEVAGGYTEAMSISGSPLEIVLAFQSMLVIVGLVACSEMRRFQMGESSLIAAGGRVAIVVVFLLVCAKGGLVRHDAHAIMVWYGLGFAAAAYCAFSWRALSPRLVLACLALVGVGLFGSFARLNVEIKAPTSTVISDLFAQRQTEYRNWADFFRGPTAWLSEQDAREQAAMARLRSTRALPKLDGTVDTIASVQSALIANGLQYWPRPVLQEYVTYTHGLIERNRTFFRSSRAPEYLLMAPGSIDGRHPATAEGAIWPDLLARYAPRDVVNNMALLRRRERPLDIVMQPLRSLSAPIDTVVDLGVLPDKAIFAYIDIQPTIWGRLANLIFKSATLFIAVQYVDGTEARYRFLPAIAREGFFLSPLIATAEGYLFLATGQASSIPQKVKSFVIQPGTLASWLWSNTFTVRLNVLEDDTLRAAVQSSEISPEVKRRTELASIVNLNPSAKTAMLAEGMLAHAPTTLNVPAGKSHTLDIGFGLVDGSWKGEGNTDGVCFRVKVAGSPSPLWERCLDPKQVAADRGPQEAEIALPDNAESLTLETACGKNCAWDWSYWRRISPQ
jgi:hypothetical protein